MTLEAVALSSQPSAAAPLPPVDPTEPGERLDHDLPSLAVLQRRYIDRVLERTGRNKTRAARMLGIDRRTLNRMLARERAKKASVKVDGLPR
jgi:DNA-binding NtrC family response regulator